MWEFYKNTLTDIQGQINDQAWDSVASEPD